MRQPILGCALAAAFCGLLAAADTNELTTAEIIAMERKVMDAWVASVEHHGGQQSLFRTQYNELGKLNLAPIERIINAKYRRGVALNRQHPFVEVLVSDIAQSGETLDLSELVREPLPPAFHRLH